LVIGFFVLVTVWWIALNLSGEQGGFDNYLFGAVYGTTVSLFGGIVGLVAAKQWGGWKSLMGRAIMFLSFGLLAEFFGQTVNSCYNLILGVEILYPSLGDVGFFGNIPFYLIGIILLAMASGVKISLKSFYSQIQAVIFPVTLLFFSYMLFLRGYEFDWSKPLTIFLDFGYPLGQALYVSVALLTYSLSRKVLGGIMRNQITFLLVAFVAQYLADSTFLFYNANGMYYVGNIVDYLYFVSYTLMTLGLIKLRMTAQSLRRSN